MVPSVSYLGHVIDANGLRPLPEKVQAIQHAPTPKNVTELKSYLGLLTYFGKFLPNLSTCLAPFYKLLSKHEKWEWSSEQESNVISAQCSECQSEEIQPSAGKRRE